MQGRIIRVRTPGVPFFCIGRVEEVGVELESPEAQTLWGRNRPRHARSTSPIRPVTIRRALETSALRRKGTACQLSAFCRYAGADHAGYGRRFPVPEKCFSTRWSILSQLKAEGLLLSDAAALEGLSSPRPMAWSQPRRSADSMKTWPISKACPRPGQLWRAPRFT